MKYNQVVNRCNKVLKSCKTIEQVNIAYMYNKLLVNHWYKSSSHKIGRSFKLYDEWKNLRTWITKEKSDLLRAM